MSKFDEKFEAAMDESGCEEGPVIYVDDAIKVTAKVLDISEHDARLMVRDAIASGELVGIRNEGGILRILTPDDIVRSN